ncbi:arsenic resistance protein [Microbacterium sp. No. 7]|uniref:arsenic resistance protein n=1 Tax=Microbacterium sp. No. 7 TaxID=1714373 RepID=UPI0006D298B4|nr:bile acid:sodium symporter [Microbacterium sp. No. 7]ALJ20097.1 arsenic resistance protein [Microbacterium sp. No. 7]
MERHQVVLYLAALALGAVAGLAVPAVAAPAEALVTPVLALVLYATFLGVPFSRLGAALRDRRFLLVALVVNFVLAPLVVFAVSRVVAHDDALLIGVLLVLLTPCVDYVIAFTGVAGGDRTRLLAVTPVLMIAQMLLLPPLLWIMTGGSAASAIDLAPFAEAFLVLIVVPLAAAGLTQAAARTAVGGALLRGGETAMVPLMVLTLAVVVASQVHAVVGRLGALALTVPVYLLFAIAMTAIGVLAGRAARLAAPAHRAIVFTGVTRNSLVVLPLALALPAALDLAPLAVVTQTLVELVVLVVLVRLVPRLVPGVPGARA